MLDISNIGTLALGMVKFLVFTHGVHVFMMEERHRENHLVKRGKNEESIS